MEDFPEAVRNFLVAHISSVEQLEALLLLKSQPDRNWTVEAVAKGLYTPAAAAAMRLADLHAHGLVALKDAHYRYSPATPELDSLVDQLADIYRERRVSVITLIYSKPSSQVQAFADAFKLRREK